MTGAAGALLTVDLDTAAAHFGAGKGALRSLALIGQVSLDYLVYGVLIYFGAKHVLAQGDLADVLAGDIVQCYVRHFLLSFPLLNGFPNHYQGTLGAGDSALYEQQVPFGVYSRYLKVLHRYALAAHVAREALGLEHFTRVGAGAH